MWFVLFCICIVIIVLDWFIAKEFYNIAKKKGYSEQKYFWWSFWCTFAGWLMVIALPSRTGSQQGDSVVMKDELPEL